MIGVFFPSLAVGLVVFGSVEPVKEKRESLARVEEATLSLVCSGPAVASDRPLVSELLLPVSAVTSLSNRR